MPMKLMISEMMKLLSPLTPGLQGVKQLVATPKPQAAPKNDLSDVQVW